MAVQDISNKQGYNKHNSRVASKCGKWTLLDYYF